MSFEIYMPSHMDDWGEQHPQRVFGTGEGEEAAWRTARRHLCFTAQIHLIGRCRVREIATPPAPAVSAESETRCFEGGASDHSRSDVHLRPQGLAAKPRVGRID
jgi:hypothetical protein